MIGPDDGLAVWIDLNGSNTGTEKFVDGTSVNPVSTIEAAMTIAESLDIRRFFFVSKILKRHLVRLEEMSLE